MKSRLSSSQGAFGPISSKSFRITLMLSQGGVAGLWAPSAIASAELAAWELNSRGGLLGRDVEVVCVDCGETGDVAAQHALDAVELDGANALIGMFPSYARAAVAQAIGNRIAFLYTPPFEGGERSRDVITTGETTDELLVPAIKWLTRQRQIRRVFLCGSDYRWPRDSFGVARRIVQQSGAEVVGQAFQPLGDNEYGHLLETIDGTSADLVIPMYLGLDQVAFNRAFASSGLSSKVMRCAPGLDETILYGLLPEETENLYSACGYFSTSRTRNNGRFLERYYTHLGDHPPPPNAYGQSVYEGVYSLAALVEACGTLDPRALRQAVGKVVPVASARNGSEMRPVGARPSVLVAEVQGYDINILEEQVNA